MLNINLDLLDPYIPEWLRYLIDRRITQQIFENHYGRSFNWNSPKSFSEKIQVLKISRSIESYSRFVDKWEVRDYVKKMIGEEYLIKTYGCFESVEQVDFGTLPERFVIKPTHGSGWHIICRDKQTFDWKVEKRKLKEWLSTNFYFRFRERQYRTIKPRLIVEENLQINNEPPCDYKIYCFDGKPLYINVVTGRFSGNKKQFMFDLNWNLLYLGHTKSESTNEIHPRPRNLEELLNVAARLSAPFPHVRVDLYNIHTKIYFSELTFTDSSGLFKWLVGKWDLLFGRDFKLKI